MNKGKGGAQNYNRLFRSQVGDGGIKVESPRTVGLSGSDEYGRVGAYFASNGFKHVNEGGMRRVRGWRGEDEEIAGRVIYEDVSSEPNPRGSFIERERGGIVEMAAGAMFGRSAGMENFGALLRRKAGEFQVFECRPWNCGNIDEMRYFGRSEFARFTQPSIRQIMFELEAEEGESQGVEFNILSGSINGFPAGAMDEVVKPYPEVCECSIGSHAVFILPGWFSATAWKG